MESQTPIRIHIPPSLRNLAVPLSTFLSQHEQYTNLAVASFIFTPSTPHAQAPRLLIVQRASNERSFRNLWEVPGGGCEVSDPTILHSLARETFEETGLRLTRFCRQIGPGVEIVTGYGAREKRWCKLSFEIEVAQNEGGDMSCEISGEHGKVTATDSMGCTAGDGVGKSGGMKEVSVTLDLAEHQAYAWVTEKEIREDKYQITTTSTKDLMLEAFALKEMDAETSKALPEGAISAVPASIGALK